MTREDVPRRIDAGLCESCAHAQIVTSSRQSVFYLCQLSATNPKFAKYPRLPVRECEGYADQRSKVKSQRLKVEGQR